MCLKQIALFAALMLTASAVFAQPRMGDRSEGKTVPAAPTEVKAKYEGGMFGYGEKETGTLKFDDANVRLVFYGEDKREKFWIPYASVLVVYADEKSVSSTAGQVVSHIPLPGAGLASLIKEKRRYLILQYDDPDVDSKGTASFKLENKDILESMIHTIGGKAKLKRRGDAFIRPKPAAATESN